MGSLIGHVAPGLGFFLIGLWHLYNNIKLFSLHPNSFRSLPWFPFPKFRHLELVLIGLGSSASIAMELFLGPARHQPLDTDLTIPSNHLKNFEHASISLCMLFFAVFARVLDGVARPVAVEGLVFVVGAVAFGQEWMLFHLHSTDHVGVEGQYHWLLGIIIVVSFGTALLGVSRPCSFVVAFVRSTSIASQGLWFIIMGYALWTPSLIPKGCFINDEDGHNIVRCKTDGALQRAKSLANIEFSGFITASVALSLLCFIFLSKKFDKEFGYGSIEMDELDDLELQKKININLEESD